MKKTFQIIVITCLAVLMQVIATAQKQQEGKVEVVGEALIKVAPDQVQFNLSINHTDADFSIALDELNAKVAKLKKALAGVDVKANQIKTSHYAINEHYSFDKMGKRKKDGHRAVHHLEVRIPFDNDRLKTVYKAIKESGVELTLNLSFTLSYPKKYDEELYMQAVKNAQRKAQVLAEASGVEIGKVAYMSTGSTMHRPVPYNNFALMEARMGADANFAPTPGDLNLTKSVTVIYYLNQE